MGDNFHLGDRASAFAYILISNARIARSHRGEILYFGRLNWFYATVRNGSTWDYKQRGSNYEDFGNFNFGFAGAAADPN